MDKLISALVISFLCLSFTPSKNDMPLSSTLKLEFDQIRSNTGKIYVFIYNYENQYPENPYLNFEIDKKMVSSSGKLTFTIPDLMRGKYAISVLDDENSNEDLDVFLGVPTEGYGFSNNIRPFLALPEYHELLFDLDSDKETLNLSIQYVL